MLTLDTVLLLKVLLSLGNDVRPTAHKLQFHESNISYLPSNELIGIV